MQVVATEALQCPTLLANGFGAHRIEGIGDKHVPWVHNVRNTDMVAAIDDEQCMQPAAAVQRGGGRELPRAAGRAGATLVEQLPLLGHLRHLQPGRGDQDGQVLRDGRARRDLHAAHRLDGALRARACRSCATSTARTPRERAARHFARYLEGIGTDHLRELTYHDRKALHNFKYFTWVEQQGRTVEELRALWDPDFWTETFAQVDEWDRLIEEFNERTGRAEDARLGGRCAAR